MPKCKNYPNGTYTGTEPSPKGLGYCASGEKEGTKMKGKDKNMWIKKNGRWVKYNICNYFVLYEIPISKNSYKTLEGLKSEKEGYIYKFIDYNKFEETLTKVPQKAIQIKLTKNKINEYYCGNKKIAQHIKSTDIHKGCKKYYIHDNGGRPFLVCIKNKDALIYKIPDEIYKYNGKNIKDYHYSELVEKYHFEEVFIPKGYDGADIHYNKRLIHIKKDDGNSILLKLKNKYIYIGHIIYEFTPKDEIIKYYSPIGNNDVPYPLAVGEDNVYFMLDQKYVPLKYFEGFNTVELVNGYQYYYGHSGSKPLSKHAKKMSGLKNIYDER